MALSGSVLGKLILAQCSARGIRGSEMPRFSAAIGEGVVASFKEMNKVTTIDVGVLTVGKGKGKMAGIIPDGLVKVVIPLLMAQGILGTRMKDLAEGLCYASAIHFNIMNVVETSHSTVALGSGTGKVLGLTPGKMESKIMEKMKEQNYDGTHLKPLVKAFSIGFCLNVMATAIVTVAITGAPAPTILGVPIPSAGKGKGKVK